MRSGAYWACAMMTTLTACAGPAVVADTRGSFDTVSGLAGGNEFSALAPAGQRQFVDDPKPPVRLASDPALLATATATVAAPPPAHNAPALVAKPALSAVGPTAAIVIDANAFGAVFGSTANPVRPSAAQLLQLDSLSLLTAEPLRTELQQKILACRRAAEACRLQPG